MLLPTKLGEFTPTCHQLVFRCFETRIERLTLSRQLLVVVRLCQESVEILIQLIIPIITRSMTGIMAHIERRVAIRCLCQLHILKLVGTVVAIRLLRARLQHFVHIDSLGTCTHRQDT